MNVQRLSQLAFGVVCILLITCYVYWERRSSSAAPTAGLIVGFVYSIPLLFGVLAAYQAARNSTQLPWVLLIAVVASTAWMFHLGRTLPAALISLANFPLLCLFGIVAMVKTSRRE